MQPTAVALACREYCLSISRDRRIAEAVQRQAEKHKPTGTP